MTVHRDVTDLEAVEMCSKDNMIAVRFLFLYFMYTRKRHVFATLYHSRKVK